MTPYRYFRIFPVDSFLTAVRGLSLTMNPIVEVQGTAEPNLKKRRCDYCTRIKKKCDKNEPCSSCRHLNISCTYSQHSSTPKAKRGPVATEDILIKRQKTSEINQGFYVEKLPVSLLFFFFFVTLETKVNFVSTTYHSS